jgi:hypothetical protein
MMVLPAFDALHCRHKADDALLHAFIEAWSGEMALSSCPCVHGHASRAEHIGGGRSGGTTKVVYRVGSVGESKGFILTTILGIVGAFVATYLSQAVGW